MPSTLAGPPYVALLRGVNVGGHRRVRMQALGEVFAALGCAQVRTVLASGNVVFAPPARLAGDEARLAARIERALAEAFGHETGVVLRPREELQRLAKRQPFGGERVMANTRLFVTFVAKTHRTALDIPYTSPDGSFRILCASEREVCSVLTLGPHWGANLRQMEVLERAYGGGITTRSWSTVLRLAEVARAPLTRSAGRPADPHVRRAGRG